MATPTRAMRGAGLVGLLVLATVDAALAADGDRPGRILVGLGVQVRSLETLSYADVRPITHGESGGRVELGVRIAGPWWASVAGHFSGAWFDYTSPDLGNGPPISGKIEDFSWLIRGGLDHRGVVGPATVLYCGVGGEYGVTRSWLDALNQSDEGPHVYLGGGYLKAGASRSLLGSVQGYVEVIASSYHAHARRARFQTTNNWLGRSMEAGAGLRLILN